MTAGIFVGRIGGLAVALGVGVAVYGGGPVAWADTGAARGTDDTSAQSGADSPRIHPAARRGPARASDIAAATTGPARSAARGRSSEPPVAESPAVASPAAEPPAVASPVAEAPVVDVPRSEPAPAITPPTVPAPVATVVPAATVVPVATVAPGAPAAGADAPNLVAAQADPTPQASPAPAGAVAGVATAVGDSAADPFAALGDLLPTDSPLSWAMLAFARRQPATGTTAQPAAQVTASSLLGGSSIATSPTVVWKDGVLQGTLNATTTSGDRLSYVGVSTPSLGGKLGGGPLLPLTNYGPGGSFSYIPYASTLTDASQRETWKIMALENSPFDVAVEKLLGPLGALLVPQVLAIVHRIPLVGDLLSPVIGQAEIVEFDVSAAELADGRPTAFTYQMPSFDGTLISVNYFPALNVASGAVDSAPTVLAASGLACAANTDPNTDYGQLFAAVQFGSLTPGIKPLREDAFKSNLLGGPSYDGGGGYNVLTWDPRGEFASGGQLQIDNPMFEGRDVSAIISWLTSDTNPAQTQVKTATGDPLIGMTGGSYGGGIQLTTVDPRIDAIAPEIAWNSLLSSLYPVDAFKTGWGSILAAALAGTGARVNPAIYQGILTGALFGTLSPSAQAVLGSVGPTSLLTKEQAPTLLFQGIDDTLFPLAQSVANGQTIQTSPADPPLKLFWFCGGHGVCDIANPPEEQDVKGVIQNLQWMDQYVAKSGTPADAIPTFQWYDQDGLYFSSDKLPWDPSFNQGAYRASGAGGFLGLWPVLGGSGGSISGLPFSVIDAGKAWNAVNTSVTPTVGKQVVGAPTVSFSYSGLGTGHTVYAQLVDDTTGQVLSNIVTPVPVTLDGRTHQVSIAMEDIAYTVDPGDTLTLQITSSAFNYENFWSYGWINISDIGLDMPLHNVNS